MHGRITEAFGISRLQLSLVMFALVIEVGLLFAFLFLVIGSYGGQSDFGSVVGSLIMGFSALVAQYSSTKSALHDTSDPAALSNKISKELDRQGSLGVSKELKKGLKTGMKVANVTTQGTEQLSEAVSGFS